jgi:hypothetical protein
MKIRVEVKNGIGWESVEFDSDDLISGTINTETDIGWPVRVIKMKD